MDKEKKSFAQKMSEESMYYLVTCLSEDEDYKITEEGFNVFFYRYISYKLIHCVTDLLACFFLAVSTVFMFSTLIELGVPKCILVVAGLGLFSLLKKASRLRSVEYSIGVGRLVARTIDVFPDYYISKKKEPEEEKEDGRTE